MSRLSRTVVYVEDGIVEQPSVYHRVERTWICGRCGTGKVEARTGTHCSTCRAEVARVEWGQITLGDRFERRLRFWLRRALGPLLVALLIVALTSVIARATWTERLLLALCGAALAFAFSATLRAVCLLLLYLAVVAGLVLALVRIALWGWALVL